MGRRFHRECAHQWCVRRRVRAAYPAHWGDVLRDSYDDHRDDFGTSARWPGSLFGSPTYRSRPDPALCFVCVPALRTETVVVHRTLRITKWEPWVTKGLWMGTKIWYQTDGSVDPDKLVVVRKSDGSWFVDVLP